jgi:streptogramin lyase
MERMARRASIPTLAVVNGAAVALALMGATVVPASAAVGDITEFGGMAVNARPTSVASGPDGNIWFTEFGSSAIGKMSTGGTVLGEFPVTTPGSGPFWVTAGPDGNLWFTEFLAGKIGKVSTSGTMLGEFAIPSVNSGPDQIAAGPDGNLWFTEFSTSTIAKITPAGVVTEVAVLAPGAGPTGITAGPDGNLWFVEQTADKIGKITTGGTVTEVAALTSGATPAHITRGPDGNLWFTEYSTNVIGRITTAGVVTEFPIPTAGSSPGNMTTGSDGNLWFTQENAPSIGRITPAGVVTEFPTPSGAAGYGGITTGSDGNVWFGEELQNRIGRVAVYHDPSINALGSPVTATEGRPFTGKVAAFTDPDSSSTASEYSATIAWGDGTSSAGTITGGAGNFIVSGTKTYLEEGSFAVAVTVSDVDAAGTSSTAASKAAVSDGALTATGATMVLTTQLTKTKLATFSDGDPGGILSDYSVKVAWGDGTATIGVVSGPTAGVFSVTASHTYAKAGAHTVTSTICDAGGRCVVALTHLVTERADHRDGHERHGRQDGEGWDHDGSRQDGDAG